MQTALGRSAIASSNVGKRGGYQDSSTTSKGNEMAPVGQTSSQSWHQSHSASGFMATVSSPQTKKPPCMQTDTHSRQSLHFSRSNSGTSLIFCYSIAIYEKRRTRYVTFVSDTFGDHLLQLFLVADDDAVALQPDGAAFLEGF